MLISRLKHHAPFLIVLGLYLILAISYAGLIPLGEAPDEAAHLSYARYIAKNGRLPATLQERSEAGYRATWPPLYHLLVAAPVALVGDAPPTRLKSVGDTPRRLIPTNGQTIAAFIHTDDEAWPWQGITLAWHLGRLISVLLSTLALCVTYLIIWRLTHHRLVAASVAALQAFLPQFLFVGSVINDDNLLNLLSGLVLLTVVVYTQRSTPPTFWHFLLLGALLGLATVAKYNALPLWAIVFIWTIWLTYRAPSTDSSPSSSRVRDPATQNTLDTGHGPVQSISIVPVQPPVPKQLPSTSSGNDSQPELVEGVGGSERLLSILLMRFVALATGAALTAGWWFVFIWRNFNQVDTLGPVRGSLTALSAGTADASLRRLSGDGRLSFPSPSAWLEWITLLFQSFWGLFGGGSTIPLPGRHYWLLALITLSAIIALITFYASHFKNTPSHQTKISNSCPEPSRRDQSPISNLPISPLYLLIPLFFLPLPILRFILSHSIVETAQSRHLFPALPFIAFGLVLGLLTITFYVLRFTPQTTHRPVQIVSLLLLPVITFTLSLYSLNLILNSYPPPIPLRTTAEAVPPIKNKLRVNIATGVTLLGFELGEPTTGVLPVTLLWRADAVPPEDYRIKLTLTGNSTNQPLGNWLGQPIGGRYPTRAWDQDDILRDTILVPFFSDTPTSNATLALTLLTSNHQPTIDPLIITNLQLPISNYQSPITPAQLRTDNLPPNAPFTYRSTLSFVLPNQTEPPTLIAPDGQTFSPASFISTTNESIAHFLVAPNWPSGNYQSPDLPISNLPISNRHIQLTPPPMDHPLDANFANQITLLGYDLPQRRVQPGQSFPLTLHLRAEQTMGKDLIIFNHLLDQDSVQRGGADRVPQQYYTTLLWVPGEIVSDAYDVPVDSAAPPGIYRLDVGLYPADDPNFSLPLFVDNQPIDRRSITIGPIKVGGPPPNITQPEAQPQTPLNIHFGNQITLLGFDLTDANNRPISNLQSPISNLLLPTPYSLLLYWQADTLPATDYTVFLHILNSDDNIVAQIDSPPAEGAYPTSLWESGEIIADKRSLPDLPPGRYTILAGLYQPDTGQRLPVEGASNGAVNLLEFEIEE